MSDANTNYGITRGEIHRASDEYEADRDWVDTDAIKLFAEYQAYIDNDGEGDRDEDSIIADIAAIRGDFISDNAPTNSYGDVNERWCDDLLGVMPAFEAWQASLEFVA